MKAIRERYLIENRIDPFSAKILKMAKAVARNFTYDEAGDKWAMRAIKASNGPDGVSLQQMESLREVGLGYRIPQLVGCRSLGEELILLKLPVRRQLAARNKPHWVAVRRKGQWVRGKKFIHEIKDHVTVKRLFDSEAKKFRSYEEQIKMA